MRTSSRKSSNTPIITTARSSGRRVLSELPRRQLYPSVPDRSPNASNGSTPELLSESTDFITDHHRDNTNNNNQQQRRRQLQEEVLPDPINNKNNLRFRRNAIKCERWSINNDSSSKSSSPNSSLADLHLNPLRDLSPTASTSQARTKYDWKLHSLMLCRHIFTRGLIDGVGSDISVHVPAWGKVYNLHRIILDQNPYFSSLLEGGFQESSSDNVTLHFEDNPFITDESFYFVLTQLYGKLYEPDIHRNNVRQRLATCSFFQLEDMADLCVQFILQTLDEENVIQYLIFADEYMVYGSDRILNAAFTYLCREIYSMRVETVVQLPVHWIEKIIESDAFWVPR
ncbi:hypothetical protein BDC45DRAFT_75140 [Circinella umbellata]|nr:hypothetical protein BDC45DRAFT_75140 [Circinella umbellata]